MALFHGTVRFGTVHFWGVFHWVLYVVPGTFLVPPQPRFQAIRTVTKTWRENGRRKSSLLHHWTCHTRPNIDPLDLNLRYGSRVRTQGQTTAFTSSKRTDLWRQSNPGAVRSTSARVKAPESDQWLTPFCYLYCYNVLFLRLSGRALR